MQDVRRSFERARRADFALRFYELLLASDPSVKKKFERTNFTKQRELLIHGVYSMLDYAEGKVMGKMAMERLARLHDSRHMDIPPTMYDLWLEAFVDALGSADPEFDGVLEGRWRNALRPAIELMVKAYRTAPPPT